MSCADDLTHQDLTSSVATEVLERVSAGEGSNVNLYGCIDRFNVTGVNLEEAESAPRVIKTWDERLSDEGVASGVDDDLILTIPFTSSLRLRSLLLLPPPPTTPNRPTRCRIYINLPNAPDFSDIDDMNPVMDFDISTSNSTGSAAPRDLGGRREVEEWPLKVQKMASVWSVTLYFSDTAAGQQAELFYVGFKGDAKKTAMDLTKLGNVPAANAADSQVDGVAEKRGVGSTTIR